jgi:glycosyltransferase involved in cell wall biosynthesis
MKRIAFFGPLPPTASGVSDYDEELLQPLRKEYRIDVFVDQRQPTGESVFAHQQFFFKQKSRPYDFIIYQMGNSIFHEYIYSYAFEYPGAIVFHDYCLHQSRTTMLLRQGLFNEYEEEIAISHPEAPKLRSVVTSGAGSSLLFSYYPMVRLLLMSALVAGAHTDFVAEKLRITETPVVKIPMAVVSESERFAEDPFPGKFVIASFGLATNAKRIPQVFPAISRLKREHPETVYLIVGEIASHLKLQDEIEKWNLQDTVHVTGRVEKTDFLRYMSRADVVINLRHPSAGEMSATLLRALSARKPVLISRLHYLSEIPENVVLRVSPSHEADDAYRHLRKLIEDSRFKKAVARNAKRFVEQHQRFDQMVDAYRELIDLGLERKESFQKPVLPVHLRSAKEILDHYIRKTSLTGLNVNLLNEIPFK